jgi:uncharacterized NAD(P)/FAD-binding protein YdhS
MQIDFAIIGGGLTATAMLCRLVQSVREKTQRNRLDPAVIGIQIYEKQDIFGPGFPHNDRFVLPFHITNMCASDMGILDGAPGDFQDWVTQNSDRLRSSFFWFGDKISGPDAGGQACNHYPRAVMGEYLKTRFQEAAQLAQELGLTVALYPGTEVVDLKLNGNRICLIIKALGSGDIFKRNADRVLLATGPAPKLRSWHEIYSNPAPFKSRNSDRMHRPTIRPINLPRILNPLVIPIKREVSGSILKLTRSCRWVPAEK